MILILFVIFFVVGTICFLRVIENSYSDLVGTISITSLIFSAALLGIMLVKMSSTTFATEETRKECVQWAKEISNIKSDVLRIEVLKKIKEYNVHLKAKQKLNKNFLFDLLIDEEITNLKPILIQKL